MEASESMCCDDASAPAADMLTAAESEVMCSQEDTVAPMESAAVPTAEALGSTEPIVEVGNEVALIQHMLGLGPGTSASMVPEISGSQVKEVVFASHPVADAEIDISSSESESEEEEVDKKGGGRVEGVMEEEDAGFVNPKEVKTKHELHYSVRCLQHQSSPLGPGAGCPRGARSAREGFPLAPWMHLGHHGLPGCVC